MQDINLYYVLGLFVVVLYATERFNTPETNRLSTTSSKYYTGLVMYISVYSFLYHALFLLPGLDEQVHTYFPDVVWLPKELVSALLLTIFLPSMPYIKSYDKLIKDKIYYLVNIPQEVMKLSRKLANSSFEAPEDILKSSYAELIEYGFDENKMDILSEDFLTNKWIKATVFKNKIKNCIDSGCYESFRRVFIKDFERIQEKYNELRPLMLAYVNSNDGSLLKDGDIAGKIDKTMHSLFDDVYQLIASAVLSKSTVPGSEKKIIEQIGFTYKKPGPGISWDMISLIFISVFILFIIKFVVIRDMPNDKAFLIAFQISISYCVAVFWALYPKLYWGFSQSSSENSRLYLYYLMSAVLTFLTVLIVRALIISLTHSDYQSGYDQFIKTMPWQIPSSALALVLCFFLDTKLVLINRWAEGLLGAIIMCLTYAFTMEVIEKIPAYYDFAFAALLGVLVFSYVPHWYRNTLLQEEPI